jgi:hypothetical protein
MTTTPEQVVAELMKEAREFSSVAAQRRAQAPPVHQQLFQLVKLRPKMTLTELSEVTGLTVWVIRRLLKINGYMRPKGTSGSWTQVLPSVLPSPAPQPKPAPELGVIARIKIWLGTFFDSGRTSVFLDHETIKRLKDIGRKSGQGLSASQLIRTAISEYIERNR